MKYYFLSIFILLFSFNCLSYAPFAVGPTHGLLFTQNKFPGEFNSSNDVKAEKRAEGCLHQISFLVVFGNASAGRIAKENKIIRISSIDHKALSVLGTYYQYCTIIAGEEG